MIEAYKVGVTLALNNLVAAELTKMAAQFASINKAAETLNATLKSLSMSGAAMAGIGKSFGDGFKYAAAEIDGVRQKINELKAASAGMGGGGGGGPPRNTGFWGPGGGSIRTLGHYAEAYGVYDALKSGMSMDDAVARALVAMNLPMGPGYMASPAAGAIKSSIFATSTGFGVSQSGTQEAALQAIRALDPLTPEQRLRLLPSLMNFAGAEVLGKHGTTMEEATEAGIGLAHQVRAYSPEQIEPLLGAFAKLSMASPASLTQMSRASSYYLPLLTAGLNMDPAELMGLGTVGSQMGLNTKSGTWLSQMFQAPFIADLTNSRHSQRRAALQALGLIDAQGKPVTKDPFEFLQIMSAHASGMSPEERMRDFVAGFGQQGARAAAIYTDPAVMKNVMGLATGLRGARSPAELQREYSNSPMVQFDKATQEFMKALTQLGENVMPEVTGAINVFTLALKAINAVLQVPDYLGAKTADGIKWAWHKLKGDAVPSPAQQQSLIINHETKLDGHTLAKSVTQYQVDGMAQMPSTGNDYDLRATPYMPGYSTMGGGF